MSSDFVGHRARSAFALGLTVGAALASAAFAWLGRDASPPLAAIVAADATPPWHRGLSPGDLEAAVRVSTQFLALPGAPDNTLVAASASPADQTATAKLERAEDHRRRREFRQACDLFAAVAAAGGMTADAWADYADAQASIAGRIAGEPARAIDAALALDPRHTKALWLQASLAHEEGRYAEALAAWKRLLAVVPAGSSDARIVEANIVEAARLATG